MKKLALPLFMGLILSFSMNAQNCLPSFSASQWGTNVNNVYFNNNSSFSGVTWGSPTYSWDFGDGSPISSQSHPFHLYPGAGSYAACLTMTVIDSATGLLHCTATFCDTVVVSSNCFANMRIDPYWYVPGQYQFFGMTSSNLTGTTAHYSWDFGDGNSSNSQSPVHTYSSTGTFNGCLVVEHKDNAGVTQCVDTSCFSLYVNSLNLDCDISFSHYANQFNQYRINFTSHPSYHPRSSISHPMSSMVWDFGDGTTSTQRYPSHTYSQPGNYIVCLYRTVVDSLNTGDSCSSVFCDTINIQAINPNPNFCDASFYFDSLASTAANVVIVNNSIPQSSSLYTTSYSWDFGDGNSSNQAYPQHTYATHGTYTLCLTITSITANLDTCTDSHCRTFTVDSLGNFHYKNMTGFNLNIVPPTGFSVDESQKASLDLYPNPVKDLLSIHLNGEMDGDLNWKIYDSNGRIVKAGKVEDQNSQIEVSTLPAGLYILNVSGKRQSLNRKVQVIK